MRGVNIRRGVWVRLMVLGAIAACTGGARAAITDGLVAYWPFDGDFVDVSENGHDAAKANSGGSVSFAAGFMDRCVEFGGAWGDALTAGTWNPSAATGQLSVAMWAKWKGGGDLWQGLAGKRDQWAGNDMMWQIELTLNSTPEGYTDFKREGSYPGGGFTMPVGEWVHVAVTFDGNNARTYMNGTERGSGGFSFGSDPAAEVIIGGCNAGGGNPFNGFLDEVAMWNRALTADEAAFLYNGGSGNAILGPAAEIVESGGATVVMEKAMTDSFTIVLLDPPGSDVTITLDPHGGANGDDIMLDEGGPGQPLVLRFSAGDWDLPKNVTVAAAADDIDEAREVVEIAFAVQSADPDFDGRTIEPLLVTVVDASEQVCPAADLDGDCTVGLSDAGVFAGQWLDGPVCATGTPGCADLMGTDGIDLDDFGALADAWGLQVSQLMISEFMASNGQTVADEDGDSADWIEIANLAVTDADVGGWYLTDDASDLTKWRFPEGVWIHAKGFLVVFASDKDRAAAGRELHTNFNLEAGGEYLALVAPDGRTVVQAYDMSEFQDGLFGYPPQERDISYGVSVEGEHRYFAAATPGSVNEGAFLDFVEEVRFSHDRGFYGAPFALMLTCPTDGAVIRYTTDGTEPTDTRGTVYAGPVTIDRTRCVRAAGFKTGWQRSKVSTCSYLFNVSAAVKSLPVISIVGDPGESLYEPHGVMAIVGGTYNGGVWQSTGPDSWNHPIQRGIDFERPVSAELIRADGGDGFQIDCGIRVAGSDYHRPRYTRGNNWQWNYDKFSFKLFFRSDYGESRLDHAMFPAEFHPTERFKSMMLRGGHNDVYNPFVKDELNRRLHCDMGGVAVIGNVVNLFINGEYKAFYNPSERLDHDFFREYYGSEYGWDVITQRAVRNGDSIAWNAMLGMMLNSDLSVEGNYDAALELVDVVDFVDYLIEQIYSANWDWPSNNWTVSRERSEEGRFRFHVWDAEGVMESGYLNSTGFDDFPSWAGAPKGLNGLETPLAWIYRALKANEEFRVLFGDRVQKHFFNGGALTEANIEKRFLELRAEMAGVLPGMDGSVLTTWIPGRGPIILEKFKQEDLFTYEGPSFAVNGAVQHGGYAAAGDVLSMVNVSTGTTATLVATHSRWKYLDNGTNQGTAWRAKDFPDGGWAEGPAELGYGDSDQPAEGKVADGNGQGPLGGRYVTTYFRHHFTVDDPSVCTRLILNVQRDDGAVVYLNGHELGRSNMPGAAGDDSITYLTSAAGVVGGPEESSLFSVAVEQSAVQWLAAGENVLAAEVHQHYPAGQPVTSSDVSFDLELKASVQETGSAGPVYYTLDGSDPRSRGGAVSGTALAYDAQSPITLGGSTRVKARGYTGGVWSALHEATYGVGAVKEQLRITELMYHPTDPNAEYIELQNIGAEPVNPAWAAFTNGVEFTFPSVVLDGGAYILVVKNAAAFEGVHGPGLAVAGTYTGSLNNGGERIALQDAAGAVIHDFRYEDGWFDITDGGGYSLTVRDAAGTDASLWGEKATWQSSTFAGGSPGAAEEGPSLDAIVINEVLAHSDTEAGDWIELYNTTDADIHIGGWFLSDNGGDDANLMKYEIAEGTQIRAHEYLVFYEHLHFGNTQDPGCRVPFALSENGETVYLSGGYGGALTGWRKEESFGASLADVAFGRYEKSTGTFNFVAMSVNTPKAANAYPAVGPVVISEIMYHPAGNGDAEYVELLNSSGGAVTLYNHAMGEPWKFADEGGVDLLLLDGGRPVMLAAGERLLLVKNAAAFASEFAPAAGARILEWGLGSLDNGGERVELSLPGDVDAIGVRQYIRVDRVVYSDGSHPAGADPWPAGADGGGEALGRIAASAYGNDPINWRPASPSPGN